MNKCYFCGKECGETVLTVNDKTLFQSELFRAYMCVECSEAVHSALILLRTTTKGTVKHGRWEETHISLCKWIPEDEKEEGHSFYMAEMKCSCCERYNTQTFSLTLKKPDFCQHCGAQMDGDTE